MSKDLFLGSPTEFVVYGLSVTEWPKTFRFDENLLRGKKNSLNLIDSPKQSNFVFVLRIF